MCGQDCAGSPIFDLPYHLAGGVSHIETRPRWPDALACTLSFAGSAAGLDNAVAGGHCLNPVSDGQGGYSLQHC